MWQADGFCYFFSFLPLTQFYLACESLLVYGTAISLGDLLTTRPSCLFIQNSKDVVIPDLPGESEKSIPSSYKPD